MTTHLYEASKRATAAKACGFQRAVGPFQCVHCPEESVQCFIQANSTSEHILALGFSTPISVRRSTAGALFSHIVNRPVEPSSTRSSLRL